LANFGWWFSSERFEEEWRLVTLLSVLQLTGKVEAEWDVLKRLAELCPKHPSECVSCFRLMVEGSRVPWFLLGVQDAAEEILRTALRSNKPEAVSLAERVVEDLISRGHFGFRKVLLEVHGGHAGSHG